ncbi:MAG: VWA domain-containing protein [Candidatus Adiutrix sp.]
MPCFANRACAAASFFEAHPLNFIKQYEAESKNLAHNIYEGRKRLGQIKIPEQIYEFISHLAAEDATSGHRGDLALAKAARAKTALLGLNTVGLAEIKAVLPLVWPTRRQPKKTQETLRLKIHKARPDDKSHISADNLYVSDFPQPPPSLRTDEGDDNGPLTVTIFKPENPFKAITPQTKHEVGPQGRTGRRNSRETTKAIGRTCRTTARRLGRPVSLAATLRAAAPYQASRKLEAENTPQKSLILLKPDDFREKVYRQKTGRLVIFVVDSSGSIGALDRMEEAKAAALALLSEAYQKRDRVALIAFYGAKAETLLPPTSSPDLAGRLLSDLPSGGKTPLASALVMTKKMILVEQAKEPTLNPYVILMTDGRPNIPLEKGANPWTEALTLAGLLAADSRLNFLLIDTDRSAYNDYKLTRDLALRLKAPRINLEQLRQGALNHWLAENSQ